jgi:hypothetical protein
MIFILAGTYKHAKTWANAQNLGCDEWFCTLDVDELKQSSNFHVVILESAAELEPNFFEKLYTLAHARGRIGRV